MKLGAGGGGAGGRGAVGIKGDGAGAGALCGATPGRPLSAKSSEALAANSFKKYGSLGALVISVPIPLIDPSLSLYARPSAAGPAPSGITLNGGGVIGVAVMGSSSSSSSLVSCCLMLSTAFIIPDSIPIDC